MERDRSAQELSPVDVSDRDVPDLTWLNRRLREMLMQAPSAIGITAGPEHRWAYVNIARAKMAGRSGVEEFVGKTVRETYPELNGLPFFDCLDQAYQSGIPFVGKEMRASFSRGPGGTLDDAYVDCVYQPIRNSQGIVEGLLIHTVEVTEQVRARRAVELANEREKQERAAAEFERNQLRELFQQAPAGIAILNGPDHRWSFANPTYCQLVGRPLEALLYQSIRDTLPELAGQGFFELLDQVYATGVPFIGKDMKAILHRGAGHEPEEAYFNFIYQPVRSVVGQVEAIMSLAVDVTEQMQARALLEARVQERTLDLQQAHESMRLLSARLIQAQDEERRRVARELHDSTGQYLAAIQMNLAALARDLALVGDGVKSRLDDTVHLVDQCIAEVRTLSYLLHPPLLDDVGLASAISWYVEGFSARSGVAVSIDVPRNLGRFSSEVETALFRIVQQSLANIHRHSGSKEARIRLLITEESLTVEICDDGRGFMPEILSKFRQSGNLPGVGITGMRERMNALRGTFDISSGPTGTKITVSVPVGNSRDSSAAS